MSGTIEKLLDVRSECCLSIVAPLQPVFNGNHTNAAALSDAISEAESLLALQYNETTVRQVMNRVRDLVHELNYQQVKGGIGFYATPDESAIIYFPFNVTQKVKTGTRFDVRDLLYYMEMMITYNVLSLNHKQVRFFNATGDTMTEVKDQNFPAEFHDTHEYEKPARDQSYGSNMAKNFEKDKSVVQEMRITDMFRAIDHHLSEYIEPQGLLVVAGGEKELAAFGKVTRHSRNIVAKVHGNYVHHDDQLLAHAWQEMSAFRTAAGENLLAEVRELIGKGQVSVGIEDVWKSAVEGRGLKLLIEKDYTTDGYIGESQQFKRHKKSGPHDTLVKDGGEALIEMVMAKGGEVIFFENDKLFEFKHVALQLRY